MEDESCRGLTAERVLSMQPEKQIRGLHPSKEAPGLSRHCGSFCSPCGNKGGVGGLLQSNVSILFRRAHLGKAKEGCPYRWKSITGKDCTGRPPIDEPSSEQALYQIKSTRLTEQLKRPPTYLAVSLACKSRIRWLTCIIQHRDPIFETCTGPRRF